MCSACAACSRRRSALSFGRLFEHVPCHMLTCLSVYRAATAQPTFWASAPPSLAMARAVSSLIDFRVYAGSACCLSSSSGSCSWRSLTTWSNLARLRACRKPAADFGLAQHNARCVHTATLHRASSGCDLCVCRKGPSAATSSRSQVHSMSTCRLCQGGMRQHAPCSLGSSVAQAVAFLPAPTPAPADLNISGKQQVKMQT